ncbi:MAG: hypothetical protein ACK5MN_03200 [Lachnospiraceae bacterium]
MSEPLCTEAEEVDLGGFSVNIAPEEEVITIRPESEVTPEEVEAPIPSPLNTEIPVTERPPAATTDAAAASELKPATTQSPVAETAAEVYAAPQEVTENYGTEIPESVDSEKEQNARPITTPITVPITAPLATSFATPTPIRPTEQAQKTKIQDAAQQPEKSERGLPRFEKADVKQRGAYITIALPDAAERLVSVRINAIEAMYSIWENNVYLPLVQCEEGGNTIDIVIWDSSQRLVDLPPWFFSCT